MKTVEVTVDGKQLQLCSFHVKHTGYGNKRISIEFRYKGFVERFVSITNNIRDFDSVNDLDYPEKLEGLYNIIKNSIEGEVIEWIDALENK